MVYLRKNQAERILCSPTKETRYRRLQGDSKREQLLFTTSGEEHVIPKKGIKGVVGNITVVDNETIETDEGEYYVPLALLNRSTDTTPCNEADEEPFAENYFEEQCDEDSMTTDVGGPQRKRKRAVNNEFLFY